MSSGPDYKKLAIVLGGTAVAAAVVYYLFKEDEKPAGGAAKPSEAPKPFSQMNKQDSVQILDEVISSQSEIKTVVATATREVKEGSFNLKQAYDLIVHRLPADPVERRGLSLQQFDQLLDKYKTDVEVGERIARIMAEGNEGPGPDPNMKKPSSKQEVVDIHQFMKSELEKLVQERTPDMQTKPVTVAAQSVLAARVEEKYGYTSGGLEAAVQQHHEKLSKDQKFLEISHDLQGLMAKLMEA